MRDRHIAMQRTGFLQQDTGRNQGIQMRQDQLPAAGVPGKLCRQLSGQMGFPFAPRRCRKERVAQQNVAAPVEVRQGWQRIGIPGITQIAVFPMNLISYGGNRVPGRPCIDFNSTDCYMISGMDNRQPEGRVRSDDLVKRRFFIRRAVYIQLSVQRLQAVKQDRQIGRMVVMPVGQADGGQFLRRTFCGEPGQNPTAQVKLDQRVFRLQQIT